MCIGCNADGSGYYKSDSRASFRTGLCSETFRFYRKQRLLSPNIFPCTSINEKDVVFGGAKKLDTTIANALKVIDADLYVVLTGCIPEIVGDDTAEVVSHFEDSEKPVIYASTAGFKGNNYKGHEQIIDAIIDQYLENQTREKRDW